MSATQGAAFKLQAPVYVVNIGLEQDTNHLANIDSRVIRNGSHFLWRRTLY